MSEEINELELIRWFGNNPDGNIRGFYKTEEGWVLDRRYAPDSDVASGPLARSADLNLIGSAIVPVPDFLVEELGLEEA